MLNEGNGTSSGAGKYNYGTFATLTASPLTGYEFENWSSASGNIDSKSATFSFLVTSDLNITAHFNKIPVSLNEYLQVSEISPSWYSNNWFSFFIRLTMAGVIMLILVGFSGISEMMDHFGFGLIN